MADRSIPLSSTGAAAPMSRQTPPPAAASRTSGEVTTALLDSLLSVLDADAYVLHRLIDDGSRLEMGGAAATGDEATEREWAQCVRPIHDTIASQRKPLIGEDVQRSADQSVAPLRRLGIQAYVCHVLVVGDRLVGTLAFGTLRRARFEARALALIRAVADQTALALDHERPARDHERPGHGLDEDERAALLAREGVARAEAEEASRARDEFLAVLSHQLRTPLNSMLGWVRMLRSPGLDAGQTAHALRVLDRNIKTQADIITDLLDASRIVSGTLVLDVRPIDLLEIVGAAVAAVRTSATAKGVEFHTVLGQWPIRTVGDGARLRQVALKLLSNAVKFTPSGGEVTIRLDRIGSNARLTVTDTGEGIEPGLLPRIFDRYRAREQRTRPIREPLGLGLTIVRRVVEAHGGSISAASAGVQLGATFIVELPVRQPESENRPLDVGERVESGDERLDLLRVLVVDDDEDTRDLLSVVLKERGATVVTARSVAEAYRLLSRFGPDVVLSDISMPGEDGFRLLDWVKELDPRRGRPTPVIALTAHARPEDRHRVLSAGFRGYLAKPLELSDVVRMIRSLTGGLPRS